MDTSMRWADATIFRAVALACPPRRMVVVQAWADGEGDGGAEALPVVAIRSAVADYYAQEIPRFEPACYGHDHAEMVARGWRFLRSDAQEDILVLDDELGLSTLEDARFDGSSERVVACTWPESEDAERLAPFLARERAVAERRHRRAAGEAS